MGVRENKVERYLDKQVKLLGGDTRKWVSPGRDGVPDRIAFVDGRVIFVEVKTDDGVLSTPQMREHERLWKLGARVTTVFGNSGVDSLIKDLSDDKDSCTHRTVRSKYV